MMKLQDFEEHIIKYSDFDKICTLEKSTIRRILSKLHKINILFRSSSESNPKIMIIRLYAYDEIKRMGKTYNKQAKAQ